ncbi:MAG: enoyl-CoA hydratase/isomerase family protein [Hyphomonas sp.]|nr:enoyl-CoA hydratase/isomerase family protein [Hyphomonas sp.]
MTPIIVETDGHILKIGINRPEKKNALTLDMYDQMSAALEDAEADPSIRCVIIHGLGGNFCSGNDLSGFPKDPAKGGPTPVMRFVKAFVHASVPIVAAVEGVAAGLGATMLLHFDSVIASPETRIVYSFVNLALPPEAGSSLLLPRLMGYAPAADLVLRGGNLKGAAAQQAGLVTHLVDPGACLEKAMAIATEISTKPPRAVREAKKLLKGNPEELMQRILAEEKIVFQGLASDEGREAMAAFMEKRPAKF